MCIRDRDITFSGLPDKTLLDVKAGDLTVTFEGDGGSTTLIDRFSAVGGLLVEQIEKHDFNMERLNELLPDFRLTLGAGRENLLNGYLKNNGIRFERVALDVGTDVSRDFRLNSKIYGLNIEGVLLDSLFVYAKQKNVALCYGCLLYTSHGDITSTVCFSKDNRDLGYRGLAIRVKNFSPVTDNSHVLLLNTR